MNKKKLPEILFLHLLFLLFMGYFDVAKCQHPENYCIQANATLQSIEKSHYQPILPDNKWSREVFHIFMGLLDPQGLLFSQNDYKLLLRYRDSIDNYVLECQGNMLSKITALYKQRLLDADTLVSIIMEQPFDFSQKDTLIVFDDSITYPGTKKKWEQRWKNLLKFRVYSYILPLINHQTDIDKLKQKEPEARKIIKRKQKQRLQRYLNPPKGFENQVAEHFYNAIAQSFDPHTSYFTVNEKANFESNLSTSQFSYGFEVDETEIGDITIVRLVPGGPAWKSNELHKGDVLLSIKWPDSQLYDLTLMDVYELDALFGSAVSLKMELTVRKANGQVKTVPLIKEKISTGENSIKSFILKSTNNIGFISLPGFYTEWDSDFPAGCATDMAKEIIKLKKENIDGIIIDLRFNGGGSMGEAIALAGIFIDEGPLLILKNKSDRPNIIKDINRGTIYDGPLLLMVNGYSASASEILAGCLQDYRRAIIAGSRTYGKATSQVIIPVEQSPENASQPQGFIKVTTGKMYRITGKSHQKTGIIPDIPLPEYFEIGQYESDVRNALVSDSISKKTAFKSLPQLPLKPLIAASKTRVNNSEAFKKIQNFNDSIGTNLRKQESIPLFWKDFCEEYWIYQQTSRALDSLVKKKNETYKVINNKYDKQIIDLDPYKSETNDILIKNVENDIYIEECYRILNDFINFKQNY